MHIHRTAIMFDTKSHTNLDNRVVGRIQCRLYPFSFRYHSDYSIMVIAYAIAFTDAIKIVAYCTVIRQHNLILLYNTSLGERTDLE